MINNLNFYLNCNIFCIFFSSLKTEENLFVVTTIPSDRLVIETDCPWCEIRPSHASAKDIVTQFASVKKEKWQPDRMVKGRNEPCNIV
jgi:TatD DNase family protein